MCGILAAAIWGGGAVVSRHLVTHSLGPLELSFLRYVGCFPVALAIALTTGHRTALKIGWRRLIVFLMLAGPPYQLLLIAGYAHATAGAGSLLVAGLLPMFTLLIPLLAANAVPDLRIVAGAVLAITGLLSYGTANGGLIASDVGLFIFSTAAMLWAALNGLVKEWRIDPLVLTLALALWSPVFLPAYVFMDFQRLAAAPVVEIALQTFYHGWLVALAATGLFFLSVLLVGPQIAAVLPALAPCFASLLGALLLGEALSWLHVAAISITTAGVMLAATGRTYEASGNSRSHS